MINLKENNFNVVRLVLAILVGFMHWNILNNYGFKNLIFNLGEISVDCFFIISGFLIFWSFDNDKNKKNFYIKRFFRIYPIYFFLILFQTVFFIFYSTESIQDIFRYFTFNLLFLNFLSPSVGDTLSLLQVNAINGSLWTLKNEVIFYSLVPFFFMLYKRIGVYIFILLYFISICYMLCMDYLGLSKFLVFFPSQLRLFVVGMLCYILFNKFTKQKILLTVPISFFILIFLEDSLYFKFILYPIALGNIILLIVYCIKIIKIRFDFSYSFYIIHFPIIQLSLYFNLNFSNYIVSFLTLFSIILLLSYFSEKYIEKRFIFMGKKFINN